MPVPDNSNLDDDDNDDEEKEDDGRIADGQKKSGKNTRDKQKVKNGMVVLNYSGDVVGVKKTKQNKKHTNRELRDVLATVFCSHGADPSLAGSLRLDWTHSSCLPASGQ